MSETLDQQVEQTLRKHLAPKQRARGSSLDDESNGTKSDAETLVQTLSMAYNTYKTLNAARKSTSLGGFAMSALSFAAKTYLSSASSSASAPQLSPTFDDRWVYFALGASMAIAVTSEVRWYCSDRHRYADARNVAQQTLGALQR